MTEPRVIIEDKHQFIRYHGQFPFAAPSGFTLSRAGCNPFFIRLLMGRLISRLEDGQELIELGLGQAGQGFHLTVISDYEAHWLAPSTVFLEASLPGRLLGNKSIVHPFIAWLTQDVDADAGELALGEREAQGEYTPTVAAAATDDTPVLRLSQRLHALAVGRGRGGADVWQINPGHGGQQPGSRPFLTAGYKSKTTPLAWTRTLQQAVLHGSTIQSIWIVFCPLLFTWWLDYTPPAIVL